MNKINRMITNICSNHIEESKLFYTTLFDMKVSYDSDWYVQLTSNDGTLELGVIDTDSEVVPKEARSQPQGLYLTFVVSDVAPLFDLAKQHTLHILTTPHDTFYGQRRLLLKDPNGIVVDISSPIPNFKFT